LRVQTAKGIAFYEMEAIFMKKAKIFAALMSLTSFVLSAGAYLTWKGGIK